MKILVFEDEYNEIEGLLNYVNFKYFGNKIEFTNYSKSQDINISDKLKEFDIVMIDIQLDYASHRDGISLLNEIKQIDQNKNVFIITGKRSGIKEELEALNLSDVKIINKPLDDEDLRKIINSFKI